MNILVLIKQVPLTSEVGVDEETGVIKRSSGANKMNPYDLYALETAFRIGKKTSSRVSVLTMGPPMASSVIREAYMMGADEGWLLTDRAFAGSDVLATSLALSGGIKSIEKKETFDLILCGQQTTDGDTAQVASEVSEFLNRPCVTNVISFDDLSGESVTVKSDLGHKVETVRLPYPAVFSVEKGIFQPRLPSYLRKKATAGQEIHTLSLEDLEEKEVRLYGLDGSPTQVVRIFPPGDSNSHEMLEGSSETLAESLCNILIDEKFLPEVV